MVYILDDGHDGMFQDPDWRPEVQPEVRARASGGNDYNKANDDAGW